MRDYKYKKVYSQSNWMKQINNWKKKEVTDKP